MQKRLVVPAGPVQVLDHLSRPLRSSSARIGLRSRQPGFFTDFRRLIVFFLGTWTGLVQETEVRSFCFHGFQYNESCMLVKDMFFSTHDVACCFRDTNSGEMACRLFPGFLSRLMPDLVVSFR